jgi:hypothetical protein
MGDSSYVYARNNPCFYHDPDGNIPAPYELAKYIPSGPGEQIASNLTTGPHLLAGYIAERLPSDEGFLASAAQYTGLALAGTVTTAADLVGGLLATLQDPSLIVRGTLRALLTVGKGTAEGLEQIERGNVLSGGAKITTDVAFVVGAAAGGVGIARTIGVPGAYTSGGPVGAQGGVTVEGQSGSLANSKLGGISAQRLGPKRFIRVAGQETVPATPKEAALFRESVRSRLELSQSVVEGQTVEHVGSRLDVRVEVGSRVESTLHTHPSSKIAMFSEQDISLFRSGSANYSDEAIHAVLGDKWPITRRELVRQGLEPPPLDVVKTVVKQKNIKPENLSRDEVRFPYIPSKS